jgi:hypothetical protein
MRLKFILLTLVIFSCSEENKKLLLPSSSGNLNETSVVLSDDMWNGSVGKALKLYFAKPVYGLPQREPTLNLRHIPDQVFTGFTTKNRTIIKVATAPKANTKISYNKYASPQLIIEFLGPNEEEIVKLIESESLKIISKINDFEVKEKQRRINKSLSKEKKINQDLNISLNYPSVYRVAFSNKNFSWIRKDTKTGHVNIMLYAIPNKEIYKRNYVQIRDSLSSLYIPGPIENTYMSVYSGYKIKTSKTTLNLLNAKEIRGMWEVKNQFMAGPLLGYQIDDTRNDRQVFIDGFVYAPSIRKRDYIFEIEAIIKSVLLN